MTTPTDYYLLRLPEVLRRRGRSRSAHYRKRVNRRGTVDCLKLNAGCRVRVEREVRRWKRK